MYIVKLINSKGIVEEESHYATLAGALQAIENAVRVLEFLPEGKAKVEVSYEEEHVHA